MRSLFQPSYSLVYLVIVTACSVAVAQEKSTPTVSKETTRAADRLPRNWAALELTDEQKEKIYSINRRSRESLAAVEADVVKLREELSKARQRLAEAQKKVDDERMGVLNESQKAKLSAVREKAKIRLEAKRKQAQLSNGGNTTSIKPQNPVGNK